MTGALEVAASMTVLCEKFLITISEQLSRETQSMILKEIGGEFQIGGRPGWRSSFGPGPIFSMYRFSPSIDALRSVCQISPRNTGIEPLKLSEYQTGVDRT